MGVLSDRKATVPLSKALASDEDSTVRTSSARALGKMGDPDVIASLSSALATDEDASVRAESAKSLGLLGTPEVVAPLLRALASDDSAAVRLAAAEALMRLKPREAVGPLVEALKTDSDYMVRSVAAEALGAIGDYNALGPLLDSRDDDESATVRESVESALQEWTELDLESVIDRADNHAPRAAAAEILGDRGNSLSILTLSRALSDLAVEVRRAAAEAIGRLGTLVHLENGGMLLIRDDDSVAFIPGATSERSTEVDHTPVFEVAGSPIQIFCGLLLETFTSKNDAYQVTNYVCTTPTRGLQSCT